MPKPLDDRIAAAMGQGARAATIAELIAEVGTSVTEVQAEHDRLDALSKSATTPEVEADAAADEAAKLARKVLRLTAKKGQLEARHEELLNSERRKSAIAEYERVKATRDELSARLKDRWPKLTDEIVELLREIEGSDADVERVNRNLYGNEWLISAEADARGCPGNFYTQTAGPISRFTKMKMPSLRGQGHEEMAWPARARSILAASDEAVQHQRQAAAKQRMEDAAKWKRYVVTPPAGNSSPIRVETKGGPKVLRGSPAIFVMAPGQVELAEGWGCSVRPAQESDSVGLSGASSF